jgi:drug/metabolite transporter (DMT)-like permease
MSINGSTAPALSARASLTRVLRSPSLSLAAAALFWSGNFVAGRALRGSVDPLTLNMLRWSLALALFAPLIVRDAARYRSVLMQNWRLIAGLGATGIAAFHTMVYLALRDTPAINALLTLSLAPAVILLGSAITGGSRPTRWQWIGVLVSLGGVGILLTRGDMAVAAALEFNRGDVWMLAAVVVWAIYSLLLRKRPKELPQDLALAASMFVGVALVAPVLLMQAPAQSLQTLSPVGWLAVGYIGLFSSLIAFACWSHGVAELGPERAGQYVHLMPVFGAALSAMFLGEALTSIQLTGSAVVLLGIILVNRGPAADRKPSDALQRQRAE